MSRTPRPRSSVPKPSPSGLRISPGARVTRHNQPAPAAGRRQQMHVPVAKQRTAPKAAPATAAGQRGSPSMKKNLAGAASIESGPAAELIHNLQQQVRAFLASAAVYGVSLDQLQLSFSMSSVSDILAVCFSAMLATFTLKFELTHLCQFKQHLTLVDLFPRDGDHVPPVQPWGRHHTAASHSRRPDACPYARFPRDRGTLQN